MKIRVERTEDHSEWSPDNQPLLAADSGTVPLQTTEDTPGVGRPPLQTTPDTPGVGRPPLQTNGDTPGFGQHALQTGTIDTPGYGDEPGPLSPLAD